MLAVSLPPPGHLFSRADRGDITEYFDYAHRTFDGQIPYRDFILEYPPGFLPVILAPGPANHGWFNRFRFLMLVLGSACVALLALALYNVGAGVTELAAAVLVLATLPRTTETGLVFERFDLWPAMLVLAAVVALLYGRRNLGAAALGLGAAAKVFPLALLPVLLLSRRGTAHIRRELAVFASAALALVLPFMILGPRGIGHVGKLLVRRPLHVESLGGSILLVAHRFGMYKPTIALSFAQSWDLAGTAAKVTAIVTSLVEGGALVAVWLLFARGPRDRRDLLLAVAATVLGFVAFGKVLSPQYLVWLGACVPLVLGRARPFALVGMIVASLLTRYVYLWGYPDLLRAGWVSWVMFARNLLLVAIFCSLLFELGASAAGAREADPLGHEAVASEREIA
jgi:Glycosyltransferase family 87